jgi:hypothetical protein
MGSVGTAIATILDGNNDDKEVNDDNDDDDDDYEDDDDDNEIQCLHLLIPPDRGLVECWIDRLFPRPSPIRGTPLLSRRLPSGDDRGSARPVRVVLGWLSRFLIADCSIPYTRTYRYGFGFGALERSYYDAEQKLFYGASEIGFVTISDFGAYPQNVTTLDISFALPNSLTDIKICGDYLFYTTKNDPQPGTLHIYTKAIRNTSDGTGGTSFTAPQKLHEILVGAGPDNIAVTKNCTVVATANEGEGDYTDNLGLVNPVGSCRSINGPKRS